MAVKSFITLATDFQRQRHLCQVLHELAQPQQRLQGQRQNR
jgi:hypothetical protein